MRNWKKCGELVESHPSQKARRVGHPRIRELRKSGKGGPPARMVQECKEEENRMEMGTLSSDKKFYSTLSR
jgi:hypothetical protein